MNQGVNTLYSSNLKMLPSAVRRDCIILVRAEITLWELRTRPTNFEQEHIVAYLNGFADIIANIIHS